MYLYIPIRAHISPEPPLFYARPTTWDGFRYLVFAEQFHGLFDQFGSPLQYIDAKWAKAESVLAAQLIGPGWLVVAMGAASLAVRRLGAFAFLVLLMASNVFYAMNFQDGDIDRYYLLATLVACVFVGVAVGSLAAAGSRAIAEATRRTLDIAGRRAAARIAGSTVLVLGALLPAVALVTRYDVRDQSANHEADRWVASVYQALPEHSVIISWWSYSAPLWYHRWVLGDRPDIMIIDERNILDDGWGTIDAAIRAYLGECLLRNRVPPDWEAARLLVGLPDAAGPDVRRLHGHRRGAALNPEPTREPRGSDPPQLLVLLSGLQRAGEHRADRRAGPRRDRPAGPLHRGAGVDDGSTDRTPGLADALAAADPGCASSPAQPWVGGAIRRASRTHGAS